jgi:hypothetical protein
MKLALEVLRRVLMPMANNGYQIDHIRAVDPLEAGEKLRP